MSISGTIFLLLIFAYCSSLVCRKIRLATGWQHRGWNRQTPGPGSAVWRRGAWTFLTWEPWRQSCKGLSTGQRCERVKVGRARVLIWIQHSSQSQPYSLLLPLGHGSAVTDKHRRREYRNIWLLQLHLLHLQCTNRPADFCRDSCRWGKKN